MNTRYKSLCHFDVDQQSRAQMPIAICLAVLTGKTNTQK